MALEQGINSRGRPRVHGGKRFVTMREAGDETGLSRRTLYRYIDLEFIKKPVKIRQAVNGWPRDYFDNLLAQIARGEAPWQR
jgi:predicted DNA-binding transcriptional regulator AlpA